MELIGIITIGAPFALLCYWLWKRRSARIAQEERERRARQKYPLGFNSEDKIAFGEIRIVEAFPNLVVHGDGSREIVRERFMFIGERLIVPSHIATSFKLRAILVDGEEQPFMGKEFPAEGIQAAVFTELSPNIPLALKAVGHGGSIGLKVENVDQKIPSEMFIATIIGRKIEEPETLDESRRA
jgi:hypothetical protein